jgi:hypothetical protein
MPARALVAKVSHCFDKLIASVGSALSRSRACVARGQELNGTALYSVSAAWLADDLRWNRRRVAFACRFLRCRGMCRLRLPTSLR